MRELNYKKIEAMLYNYKKNKAKIKNISIEIEKINTDYKGISSISYSEKTGSTNKINSSVENEVIEKEKRISDLEKEKIFLQGEVSQIENALEVLTDSQREIVTLKYFNKLSYKVIADRHYKSVTPIYSVVRNIICEIDELLFT